MNRVELNGEIETGRVGPVRRTERAAEVRKAEEARTSEGADRVSLSERAARMQQLAARLRDMPDMRQERVAELRELVRSGRYDPPAGMIAEAIIRQENGSR
ncbi:flagellar biosynthesis anti-sigma factor FlgM [Pyrinomonas sp.]|mgnify:CR=1 FL=1|uniref:flagellar biosynthesis anti-sigma factor FlgM n=1 Tax=Pyrinomonas sp. TaxID=2080306 RepID=UPI00332DA2AB